MANNEDDVLIYEADDRLKQKLGGRSMAQILTPELIDNTQKIIEQLEPQLLDEILAEFATLEKAAEQLHAGSRTGAEIKLLNERAFAIKSKAGFCHFPLASSLARSLHLFCEGIQNRTLSNKEYEVILCIIQSIKMILERKITGEGGKTGAAIVAETERMISTIGHGKG